MNLCVLNVGRKFNTYDCPLHAIFFYTHYVGTHDWNKFITPEELQVMIEKTDQHAGFRTKVVLHRGLVLSPSLSRGLSPSSSDSWVLSETDTDVNYISHAIRMD